MTYFNRKELLRILAEKPDMMSGFPECVLSARQVEDMIHIPGIVLCDITMLGNLAAVEYICATVRPDALLPAVVYNGAEQVRWSLYDSTVAAFKKGLGRYLHVHILPPVVLGAPAFRSALCMYAAMQPFLHACNALTCAACLFYRVAVCITLCRQCGINRLCLAGLAPGCASETGRLQAVGLSKYCAILPAGYGITLDMAASEAAGDEGWQGCATPAFECCARVPACAQRAHASIDEGMLKRYFEKFAIPFAANAISRILSGREVDFIESARTFLPAEGKKIGLPVER